MVNSGDARKGFFSVELGPRIMCESWLLVLKPDDKGKVIKHSKAAMAAWEMIYNSHSCAYCFSVLAH